MMNERRKELYARKLVSLMAPAFRTYIVGAYRSDDGSYGTWRQPVVALAGYDRSEYNNEIEPITLVDEICFAVDENMDGSNFDSILVVCDWDRHEDEEKFAPFYQSIIDKLKKRLDKEVK